MPIRFQASLFVANAAKHLMVNQRMVKLKNITTMIILARFTAMAMGTRIGSLKPISSLLAKYQPRVYS
jgi:uncharacterized membrane protein